MSGHPSRARFWRRIWVPLLLGTFLAACDTGGAGGVPTTKPEVPTEPTPPPKPKEWHVSTFAGGGSAGGDGIATEAGFGTPYGIVQIGDTLYVPDEGLHSIRTVHAATARVGTIIPSRRTGLSNHADGPGTSARFNQPRGAAAGADGKLYVADFGNNRIRSVNLADSDNTVETIAGDGIAGSTNGKGTEARFNGPSGLAVRGNTLYVADVNTHSIRAVNLAESEKTVTTIAGSGTAGHVNGAGTAAQFYGPSGLALSGDILYVADYASNRIRAVNLADSDNTVTTIAGDGTRASKDGTGTAAQLNGPAALAVIGDTLYFTEKEGHRIRTIDIETKRVSTIAGTGTKGNINGIGSLAQFSLPLHIAGSGDTLYVTSGKQIRKLEYREVDS